MFPEPCNIQSSLKHFLLFQKPLTTESIDKLSYRHTKNWWIALNRLIRVELNQLHVIMSDSARYCSKFNLNHWLAGPDLNIYHIYRVKLCRSKWTAISDKINNIWRTYSIRTIIGDTFPKHWRCQSTVNFLGIEVFIAAVEEQCWRLGADEVCEGLSHHGEAKHRPVLKHHINNHYSCYYNIWQLTP